MQLQPTTLADARFPDQSFDVVVIFHVLEHVPSPRQLCSEIFRILRPGGLLFVETPNFETLWFRILGRRWRQLIPDHYWFFSPATLRGLLERVGFVVDAVEPVGKAVSLRLAVNRIERMSRMSMSTVAKLLKALRLDERVLWFNPGDIIMATARRYGAGVTLSPASLRGTQKETEEDKLPLGEG